MTLLSEKNLLLRYLVLLPCLAGLCAYSLLFIYSTGYIGDAYPVRLTWQKQAIFLGIGALFCMPLTAFACSKEYLRKLFIRAGYYLSLLCLIMVLLLGHKIGGATRWLKLGSFLFQPAEFAKVFSILMAAEQLANPGRYKPYLHALLCCMPTFALIAIEPSYGSALSIIPSLIILCIFNRPGKKLFLWSMAMLILMLTIGAATLLWLRTDSGQNRANAILSFLSENNHILHEYHVKRIKGYLDENGTWNERQSVMTISSGGSSGKGYLEGTMKGLGYLPRTVAPTDFIFPVICEELGFFYGALPVLLLYTLLLSFLLYCSSVAGTAGQQLTCIGVALLLFTHIVVNLGMTMRLLPVIGLPLPILSYGGSYAIAIFIALGAALPGKAAYQPLDTQPSFTMRLGKILKISVNQ